MRVCRSLVLFLHLSLLVVLSDGKAKSGSGGQKLSFGQLSTMDLESAGFDGDILFDIEWPGIEAKDQALQSIIESRKLVDGDQNSDEDGDGVEVQPASFLEESYSASETITVTTIDQEQYTCVLPDLTGEAASRDTDESSEGASPRSLLKSLRGLCTKLLMGYWTYELCHSKFVRQYHEEQVEKGKFKIDEYYLGKMKTSDTKQNTEKLRSTEDKSDADTIQDELSERPPTFYFTGKVYAYYEVEMEGGTLCDISNEPRSIKIKYICDMDAHQSGTFLHIAEVTTCKYEAVISTRQLCVNKYFRLKENPRHTINCYPEGDAPRRPTVLLEHELSLKQFYPKSSKGTKHGPSLLSGVERQYEDFDPQESFEKQISKGLPPDEQFLVSFLSGDSCLRGGGGWWLHEICYGKFVRQVHEDSNGRMEVYLGYWDESEHRTWFERTGRRKHSKLQVTHLYTKGDVCDVTGTPRQCQVKFKCVKTTKASQVTIFLEEPTTCSYTLTVEASFLCPLLEKTNDIGLIVLPQYDTLTFPTNSEPPTTSGDTESSDQAGKGQSSSIDSINLRQDTADIHSDGSQSSTRESEESKYSGDDSKHQRSRGAQSTSVSPPNTDQPGKAESDESPAMKQRHPPQDGTSQGQTRPQNAHEPHVQELPLPTKERLSSSQQQDVKRQSQALPTETHSPQDGAPATEQRRSSNEREDTIPQSEMPPPEVHNKPQEELVSEKQGNQQLPDPQSTVSQSRTQHEPRETKQGHSGADIDRERDQATGSHSASSNRKKDTTSQPQ